MKVTTDGCLFGAWVAAHVMSRDSGVSRGMEIKKILDIGAGTGLLSLMLAQLQMPLFIDAIEIDPDAFEEASRNVRGTPWTEKINMICANAREFSFAKKYDIIISNPPFYDKELKGDDTKKNFAHHNEGLILPDLFGIIKNSLAPTGIFYLLMPYKRYDETKKLLEENDMAAEYIYLVRQTPRHDYFRFMLQGKLAGGDAIETIIDELSIKDKDDQYTPEFVSLLQDYYFHL